METDNWFEIPRPNVQVEMTWYGLNYPCNHHNTIVVRYEEPYSLLDHIIYRVPEAEQQDISMIYVFRHDNDMKLLEQLHFDSFKPGFPDTETADIYVQYCKQTASEDREFGEAWGSDE